MNLLGVKAASPLLTVILISAGGLLPVVSLAANLPVGDAANIPPNHALLMRAAGSVLKAEMIDESRQLLGEAVPAKVSDLLAEGSVVGTGNRSWAELKWASVTSRIWQNTVVQIRPSKRSVYLQEGGLTFNLKKDRPDKAPYDIRTKVLQARIHGTTVQVLAQGNVEKISVLEGNIDVRNLQNGSVVHLTPGVVYEVQVRGELKTKAPIYNLQRTGSSKSEPVSELPSSRLERCLSETPDFRLNVGDGELIFQDAVTRTFAYTANSKAILEHPFIGGENPIPSYNLIQDALAKASPSGSSAPTRRPGNLKLDRTIARNLQIKKVPPLTAYAVGPNVGNGLPLPQVALVDLPPVATVDNKILLEKAPIVVQAMRLQAMTPLRNLQVPAEDAAAACQPNDALKSSTVISEVHPCDEADTNIFAGRN